MPKMLSSWDYCRLEQILFQHQTVSESRKLLADVVNSENKKSFIIFSLSHMKLGIIVTSSPYKNEWSRPFGSELFLLTPLRDSLVP